MGSLFLVNFLFKFSFTQTKFNNYALPCVNKNIPMFHFQTSYRKAHYISKLPLIHLVTCHCIDTSYHVLSQNMFTHTSRYLISFTIYTKMHNSSCFVQRNNYFL